MDWNGYHDRKSQYIVVTPYAGVWIEITNRVTNTHSVSRHSLRGSVDWNRLFVVKWNDFLVTPYAGVWIEMSVSVSLTVKYLVTPYVGVWIEIQYIRRGRWIYVSLPTRECGLKSLWLFVIDQQPSSLPTRECGLKYQNTHLWPLLYSRHSLRGSVDWNRKIWQLLPWGIVTPYAGVWIEIEITPYISSRSESLPTRECGLKYYYNTIENMLTSSHSLRGSVDWNFWVQVHVHGAGRHSLRGSVDWNQYRLILQSR